MIDKELELNEQGQARRRFLKQAATVAWASPFIVTMMSRTAHAQDQCGTLSINSLCSIDTPCGTPGVCLPTSVTPGSPCTCQTP